MARIVLIAVIALSACTLRRGLRNAPYIEAETVETLTNAGVTAPDNGNVWIGGGASREPLCDGEAPDLQHNCPAKAPQAP
jgi:hypothetical protein